ncbi:hypothetical protein Cgig2_021091 [Carnegiea gigantea]|uniref:Uncharacterized protein n=1 Tax=Carnegiea gigantea TaxID=171969 RepID=A0A9Q1JQZ4_9CARY|nr:hypothetical protein Cgig2_021091 [Carnegiea gigantea]
MSEYITRHFAWDRRGIAFPQSPLPKDFQTLCPGFELAVAEQAAEYYELQELPQVIFYAMLLNEAERLGVLQGQALRSLEEALTELRWKGTAVDFELLEIVQAIFYTMLLNEAVELRVAHDFMAESMKSSLIGLRWSTFAVWMGCVDHALRGVQLHRPANEVEVRGSQDGEEKGSGPADPPAPSSDEE